MCGIRAEIPSIITNKRNAVPLNGSIMYNWYETFTESMHLQPKQHHSHNFPSGKQRCYNSELWKNRKPLWYRCLPCSAYMKTKEQRSCPDCTCVHKCMQLRKGYRM